MKSLQNRINMVFVSFEYFGTTYKVKGLIEILTKYNLIPLKYDYGERTKYNYSKTEFINFWIKNDKAHGIGMVFVKGDGYYFSIAWRDNKPNGISFSINNDKFNNIQTLIDFAKAMYYWSEASYAAIVTGSNHRVLTSIMHINESLPNITWANFFAVPYIDMWGEDKLINAPAYIVEKLKDGGYLLITSSSPQDDIKNNESREVLKSYFGMNYFSRESYKDSEGRRTNDYYDYIAPDFSKYHK